MNSSLRFGQRRRGRCARFHLAEEPRHEFGARSIDDLPKREYGGRVAAGLQRKGQAQNSLARDSLPDAGLAGRYENKSLLKSNAASSGARK